MVEEERKKAKGVLVIGIVMFVIALALGYFQVWEIVGLFIGAIGCSMIFEGCKKMKK